MPKSKSTGPRRNKGEDKPQGARSGGRTRENRSDASGSRRPSSSFGDRKKGPGDRSDKPPRRSGEGKPSGFKSKSFGTKRPYRAEGDERRDSRRAGGDREGFRGKPESGDEAGRPRGRSFGPKRPFRAEGDGPGRDREGFRGKPDSGEDRPRGKSFGAKRTYSKGDDRGDSKPGKDRGGFRDKPGAGEDRPRGKSFGTKRTYRAEGDEREKRPTRSEDEQPRKFNRGKFDDSPRPDRKKPAFGAYDHGAQPEGGRPFKKFDRSGVKRGGQTIRQEPEEQPLQAGGPIRLNRYIANSGVCSRREADQLITMGLISVNGKVVTTLGHKVNPGDEVRHENRVLRAEKPVYILMNKPKGFLTTTSDPEERNTVMHLINNVVKERIYPVGRLDRNTTGLLVLTNDGDLAEKLMHPSHNVKKIYRVELDRPITKADVTKITEGVRLEEGVAMVDDFAVVSEDKRTVGLEIHIGWNRVVRRIFESLEYQVLKLDRTMYAGLTKKDLPRGEWRFLTREEIVLLKHYK